VSVSDTLGEKAGPLPVWGWGVILGALSLGFMWWTNHNASVPVAGDPTFPTQRTVGGGEFPDPLGPGVPLSPSNGDPNTGTPSPYESNLMYTAKVTQGLVAKGKSPLTVATTLQTWLYGSATFAAGSDGAAIVEQAIRDYGYPPEGTTNPLTIGPKVVTPPPTTVKKYVRSGKRFWRVPPHGVTWAYVQSTFPVAFRPSVYYLAGFHMANGGHPFKGSKIPGGIVLVLPVYTEVK
jgi:hypothetical protein